MASPPATDTSDVQPLPRGFARLIFTQFVSGLADHALLVIAFALLMHQGADPWWAAMLKFFFTLAYVLLAPWVGIWADRRPKAQVMASMNLLKLGGVVMLLLGVSPWLAMAWVGLGAAAYAPAKYGLLTELVLPQQLVRANSWLEVSVVSAAILGAVTAGVLISPAVTTSSVAQWVQGWAGALGWHAQAHPFALALLGLGACYLAAAALNAGLPDSGARYPRQPLHPWPVCRDFLRANAVMWRDPAGRLSMAVTTLFWGVGATLQVAVLLWAQEVLGLRIEHGTYLQGVVAVGVMVGAAAVGRAVCLGRSPAVLPAGMLLGGLLMAGAWLSDVRAAALVMLLAGVSAGVLVVPLNALLQYRGHTLLTAGRSIAVQNFNENLGVLGLVAFYSLLLSQGLHIQQAMSLLGLLIAIHMAVLFLWWRRTGSASGAIKSLAEVKPPVATSRQWPQR